MDFKYFSMFTGIGGFEVGFPKEWECVGYSEVDKYAIQIYEKHFPNHKNYGDARKIDTKQLKDFNLLCAGFPCQSFSIAGKRKGFEDTRGTLFFEIARILADKRPRYFLLENVKGLLSHDEGKTFQTILGVLADLGYECQWQVLNSKDFGVPQNRERVFIIGHLGGEPRPEVFPLGEDDGTTADVQGHSANTLTARYYGAETTGTYVEEGELNAQEIQQLNQPSYRIRRLSPVECERLQGFPDGWTEGISDSQRYKCLGNAVTTNVIEAIGTRLLKAVEEEPKKVSREVEVLE